jgi:hypothetical protein
VLHYFTAGKKFFFFILGTVGSESSGDEDEELAPVRGAYIIKSHRRKDRLVQTLATALDPANYILLSPVAEEKRHIITVKGRFILYTIISVIMGNFDLFQYV